MLIYREDAMNKNKQIIQNRKGVRENNHKFFRCIVPKGTSIGGYMQSNMTLAANHINSYLENFAKIIIINAMRITSAAEPIARSTF